jgi:hypothetical protein
MPPDNTNALAALVAKPIGSPSAKRLRSQVEGCKAHRKKLATTWRTNVDYRCNTPYAGASDSDRISVPLDWYLTKQKQSALFSQVPSVRINHPPQSLDQAASWVHTFEQRINDTLVKAGIDTAMDECLPDCINAAGIGVILVSREAITENVEMPEIDISIFPPEIQRHIMETGLMMDGSPVPMTTVPKVLDSRYVISRVSPMDFLWPLSFTGSDFDDAPWIGRTGRITWAEAVKRFGLDESQREKYVADARTAEDKLSEDQDANRLVNDEMVEFDEIFYKEFCFDAKSQSYTTIHHLIFLANQEEPVINEEWKGQQFDQQSGKLVGALRYPIRVLTLTYISDSPIPPSDSAIGRQQVDEINKTRTLTAMQREHSLPIRWFDVNRVDPTIQFSLMRGTWQGMIPVQGQGTNIIGEVPRSAMHQESFVVDRMAKGDLSETWQTDHTSMMNQTETKAEVQAVSKDRQIRLSRERAKVGKFFLGIAEVLGGLLSIYEDPTSFGEGYNPIISTTLSYSILADSTVLLDTNQRIHMLVEFINFTAKSGWLGLEPVLKELATLHGLDPNVVIVKPEPRKPEAPNMSFRLTGTEDVMNPLTLAFLIEHGMGPKMETIAMAKKLIEAAVTPPIPPPAMDGTPSDLDPNAPPPDVQLPQPAPPGVGQANARWTSMERVNDNARTQGGQ